MVTWDMFNFNNNHKTESFERLSRLLFREHYCTEDTILRSNPNHIGVEVDPVKGKEGLIISFQAKYFSKGINYNQIKDSFITAAKEYQGKLDRIYLYSNEDVSTKSKSFKNCLEILEKADIDCVPITNEELLEQVAKSASAKAMFFNEYDLNFEWFKTQVQKNLNSLSNRYNKKFNAITDTEKMVALFSHSKLSEEILSKRIDTFMQETKVYYREVGRELLDSIYEDLFEFDEINDPIEYYKMNVCLKKKYSDQIKQQYNSLNELRDKIQSEELEDEERNKIHRKINSLNLLIEIIENLLLNNFEENLINNKVLLLKGEAGVGKSHTFAVTANNLIYEKRPTILLLGYSFIKNNIVKKQIVDLLNLSNEDLTGFLHILEGLGKLDNKPITIFIDGVNETKDNNMWKIAIEEFSGLLKDYNYIKIAFSFRNGFESKLISDYTGELIKKETVTLMHHYGLDNYDFEQIKTFLDYYNIAFSPSFYFNDQISNPLFLTLFCENFIDHDMNIQEIFNEMLEKIDEESKVEIDFEEDFNLLEEFISQFINNLLSGDKWTVSKGTLFSMSFWMENGLLNKKHEYIGSLIRNGLINEIEYQKERSYTFAYNLLRDYLIGNEIYEKSSSFDELESNILDILVDENNNFSLRDSAIFASEMGYSKYRREAILAVLNIISETDIIGNRFIESYTIRKNKNTNIEHIKEVVNKYNISEDIFFEMLIDNSTKVDNATNANFLNKYLSNLSLIERDSLWTQFINYKPFNSRLGQLIISFESREMNTRCLNESQVQLMLTLFSWLLTSSNRELRDRSSKAMIEILIDNFDLCSKLLKNFENANDPYVIQRLYGVIFGAIVRSKYLDSETFKDLVSYIYKTIFMAEEVYPDVLLRDFARLIIERYIYEHPDDKDFDYKKIQPPYNSKDIPEMKKTEYEFPVGNNSSKYAIISSMTTETSGPGIYGDFGRYVFDSTLKSFKDLDRDNAYHYAMDYIFNVIGFDPDLFSGDTSDPYTNRHDTRKIERIGKKYQWIAFYNLLSKVFDNYFVSNIYTDTYSISGPWDPYVRDFDPTINNRIKSSNELVKFKTIESFAFNEFLKDFNIEEEEIIKWANKNTSMFSNIEEQVKLIDDNENVWIVLNHIKTIEKNEYIINKYNGKRQEILSIIQAYFVKNEEYDECLSDIKDRNFYGRDYPEGFQYYEFFNREYYWSSTLTSYFKKNEWKPINIKTEEYVEVKVPDFTLDNLLSGKEIGYTIVSRPVEKLAYLVLPASNSFLYESQYDASLGETSTSFKIPNSDIVNVLKLQQKDIDGFFYSNDELVAFDTNLINEDYGLIIREKYLREFLKIKGYRIFWTLIGEKHFRTALTNQIWSEWSGYAIANENLDIEADMRIENYARSNKG